MKIRDALIVILGSMGGTIESKTKIQKLCYFLSVFSGEDYGFKAHYYGPYSQQVENALDDLRGIGFVSSHRENFGAMSGGFEVVRYDYTLTKSGESIYSDLKDAQESKGIANLLINMQDLDYIKLSIAAKAYYILKQENKPMDAEKIREKARGFNWNIADKDVNMAIDFLKELNLAKAAH